MLTAIKQFLHLILPPALYGGAIFTALSTIFKKAEWGLYLMIIMIPQPNIWHKLQEYPFGKDFMDILFFSIILGIIFQKKHFIKTPNRAVIIALIIITYLALWNSSMRFFLPMPISTSNELLKDWKNYAEMICLYFLALTVIEDENQQKKLVVIMSIIILLIAIRSYRNFTGGDIFNYDKRVGGPFEAVHLGANHFGAFIAYVSAFFLGLALFDQDKRRKLLFVVMVLFSLHPLFFSYSRGAYLAAFGALLFYGVLKKRSLLIVSIVLLLAWHTVLPPSVVDRIAMTESDTGEVESSAAHRLIMWNYAIKAFENNPIFGIGYGGFRFIVPPEEHLTDTHSFYMKTLCEQGIIGAIILLMLISKAFLSGWRLYRIGRTSFHKGLGLGFMGAVIAMVVSNIFGDRWSYFTLGGYFWIFWGLVDRGIFISRSVELSDADTSSY